MQYSSALSVEQISEQITKGNIVVWTLFEREIEAHLFDGGVIGSYIDENSAVMHRIVQTSGNSVTVTDVDMQGGGEPIDAYTKSESDKRFANKDDVYEEVHVGDDEPTDPRTKMWVTDEDLVEIVQEQGTSKSAVMSQDAVTKALASAGGDWELLVDNTTTEEILKWSFSQGEQGQIFDNYKKIMVFFQSQPTAKTSNLRLVWNGQNAWGTQPFVGFSITSTSVTTIGLCVIEKTPLGIVVERHFKSYNNNTLSGDLATTASSSINMATLMTSNQASTTHPFNSEITHITLGSYQVVIGAGSRIVILGKK